MIRLLLAFLCLVFVGEAQAEVLAAVGTNLTFEYGTDGRTIESRTPLSLRGGYRFPQIDLYLEYTNFHASTGVSLINVKRVHEEYLLWARKIFLPEWRVSPYIAGGGGFSYETIQTSFGTDTSKDSGTPQAVLAGATGARALFWKTLEIAVEMRLGVSQTYNPNPMFGLGFLIGVQL